MFDGQQEVRIAEGRSMNLEIGGWELGFALPGF